MTRCFATGAGTLEPVARQLSGMKAQVLKASYYNFMLSLPILAVRKLRSLFPRRGKANRISSSTSRKAEPVPVGAVQAGDTRIKNPSLSLRRILAGAASKALPRTERRMSRWKQTIQEHVRSPLFFPLHPDCFRATASDAGGALRAGFCLVFLSPERVYSRASYRLWGYPFLESLSVFRDAF